MRGSWDAVAVGGGPDALVASALLAASGRRVLVVSGPGPAGGIATDMEVAPGYRMGVAPETLPGPDPDVVEALGLGAPGFTGTAPDPVLTVVPRGPGATFALARDPERARLAVADGSASDGRALPDFAAEVGAFARFLRQLFDRPPPGFDAGAADLLPPLRATLRLGRRRLPELLRAVPMAIRDFLDDAFETEALKAALAAPALTGTRLGPRAPGTAGLFLHFHAFTAGGGLLDWIRPARGGAGAVGRALQEAARAAGARIEAKAGGVRRIVTAAGPRVRGVEFRDGSKVATPIVLSDAAARTTLLDWVGATSLRPDFTGEVRRIRYRGTAARVGLALSGLPRLRDGSAPPEDDPRLRGVVQVGAALDDLERASDAAKYGEVASAPLVFASLPSLVEAGLAPAGRHVLAATVQATPSDDGPDPAARADEILRRTVESLECAFPGIASLVTGHRVLTPATLERDFGLLSGSFHQAEPTMDQLFSLRPVPGCSDHRTPVAGLYLAGPDTSPYGGLHGVSGRNAARVIREDAGEVTR